MRVAFAGTPEFARVSLEALLGAGFDVVLVLSQPDRPAGRGLKLQASAVKQFALEAGLPVIQPRSLRLDGKYPQDAEAARDALLAARPDVMVVAAYGLILPTWVLDLPTQGCLNVHASLLPRWRGAAPIHRAIEAGDRETGVTIMQMDAGLDTGAMLCSGRVSIDPAATTGTLHDELARLGGHLMVQTLQQLASGRVQPVEQPAEGVCYAAKIDKSEAAVDWGASATAIERRIRAFDPLPGVSSLLDGESIKLWSAKVEPATGSPGTVLSADASGVLVACGADSLRITELQRPGGRRQSAQAFLQTKRVPIGAVFG
ncbi:MAG: methionyl-tRNA formyltransferase [Ideonella sp.]